MTRETKAQRLEHEQECADYEADMIDYLIATYPRRLMVILERATAENFQIYVHDDKFHLSDADDRLNHFELALNVGKFDEQSECVLDDLRLAIVLKESRRCEEKRKQLIKQQALDKLTDEEQEVLGLKLTKEERQAFGL